MPDHRGRAVLKTAQFNDELPTSPEPHPYEAAFYKLLKGEAGLPPEYQEAFELYSVEHYRHVLNAAILGKATNDQISEALEMAPTTLSVYRYLFCDRNVFSHALLIPDFIRSLDIADMYKEWYAIAHTRGPKALLKRFTVGTPIPISPDEVLQDIAADQYDRFLSHRGEQITSNIAMAALNWGKEAAKTASIIIQRGESRPASGHEAMKIALKVTDQTNSPDEVGIQPEEILTE